GLETFPERYDKNKTIFIRVFLNKTYKNYYDARYELKNIVYDFEKKNIFLKGLWIRKGVVAEYKIPEADLKKYRQKIEEDAKEKALKEALIKEYENNKNRIIKDLTDDELYGKILLSDADSTDDALIKNDDLSKDTSKTADASDDKPLSEKMIKYNSNEEIDYDDLSVYDIFTSDFLKLETTTFDLWNNYISADKIDEEETKKILSVSIENFKKIKEYFSGLKSKQNEHLNNAIKNQIDLCGEYEKMEKSFEKDKDVQKLMKFFYLANNHYNSFISNLEKAQEFEEQYLAE
ncbi:MAG TPA: hypothetical protein PLO89_06565, partial [Spirochaetota bacterium]|nr:hypothetical protein [Spirochaetota bacterium]